MTTLLAVNRKARSGGSECGGFVDRLRELGPVLVFETSEQQSLEDILAEQSGRFDRVVVGGGDGTLNRALPALLEASVPLGVLPLGTANDFARSLGLPTDPDAALDVILAGHTRRVGIGEVNGHPFLNAVGIGLGPELTRRLDYETKQRLGVLAYLSTLLEAFRSYRLRRAEIVVDGQRRRKRFMQITVANGIHYGGGMTICEDAELNDGQLYTLCLEPQSALELLGKFFTLRWGAMRSGQDKIALYKGNEVEIRTFRDMDVSADGELVTRTPARCTSRADALEVFAPAEEE